MKLRATITEVFIENHTLRARLSVGGRNAYAEVPVDHKLFARFIGASGILNVKDTAQLIGAEMLADIKEVAIKGGVSFLIATDWYRCPPNSQSV